jgi:hypothetical protein
MCSPPRLHDRAIVAFQTDAVEGAITVRFGSEAYICAAKRHVRFTPNSDHESRHAAMVMSALHPKADMCSAPYNVRYGPKADIRCRQQIFKNRPT